MSLTIGSLANTTFATNNSDTALAMAKKSLLQRNLHSLSEAFEQKDYDDAARALGKLIKNNPSFLETPTVTQETEATDSSEETDETEEAEETEVAEKRTLNENFAILADALEEEDEDAIEEAWAAVKEDLEALEIDLSLTGAEAAAAARSELKISTESLLYGTLFDTEQDDSSSLTGFLLGISGTDDSTSSGTLQFLKFDDDEDKASGLGSSILQSWAVYDSYGSAKTSSDEKSSGTQLDAVA